MVHGARAKKGDCYCGREFQICFFQGGAMLGNGIICGMAMPFEDKRHQGEVITGADIMSLMRHECGGPSNSGAGKG